MHKARSLQDYLTKLGSAPDEFKLLGEGTKGLALIWTQDPGFVLLLQKEDLPEGARNVALEAADPETSRGSFYNARAFSELYDSILIKNQPPGMVHPDITESDFFEKTRIYNIPVKSGQIGPREICGARIVRQVPGRTVEAKDFPSLPNAQKISEQIAEWLFNLHYKSGPEARAAFQAAKGTSAQPRDARVKDEIFIHQNKADLASLATLERNGSLPADLQSVPQALAKYGLDLSTASALADTIAETLPAELKKDTCPTLVHGDFHLGNINLGEGYKDVTGICDFTDAVVASKVMDFIALSKGKGLQEAVYAAYAKREEQNGIPQDQRLSPKLMHMYTSAYLLTKLVGAVKKGKTDSADLLADQLHVTLGSLAKMAPESFARFAPTAPHKARTKPAPLVPSP